MKFAEIDNKGTSKLYKDVSVAEKGNELKDILNGDSIFNRFESVAKKKSSLACPPACLGELTGKGGQGGEAGTPGHP